MTSQHMETATHTNNNNNNNNNHPIHKGDAAAVDLTEHKTMANDDSPSLVSRQPRVTAHSSTTGSLPPIDLNAKMQHELSDIRVAIVGNVDSGKSTLVGVLTTGELDNGRGLARSRVFSHNHEAVTGQTSCISQHILGVDKENQVVRQAVSSNASSVQKNKAWREIVHQSKQTVTLIDLAGHEKFLKTTLSGLTGCYPDAAIVVIGANAGISRMTKEHLGVVIALNIPVICVMTKIDMAPEHILKSNKKMLFRILNSRSAGKKPFHVKSEADVQMCIQNRSAKLAPVFLLSTVTGENMSLLTSYLCQMRRLDDAPSLVSKAASVESKSAESDLDSDSADSKTDTSANVAEFRLDDTFTVTGVGLVVSGTVTKGRVVEASQMQLGPFSDGSFHKVLVKTIHSKRTPVSECHAGHSCSMAIRAVNRKMVLKRKDLRKGMALVSGDVEPVAAWRFEADVLVLHHATTIQESYQAVIHCGTIRQTAEVSNILSSDADQDGVPCMRSGQKTRVEFRFLSRPEYLQEGDRILFREGHTKGVGIVKKVHIDQHKPDLIRANVRKSHKSK